MLDNLARVADDPGNLPYYAVDQLGPGEHLRLRIGRARVPGLAAPGVPIGLAQRQRQPDDQRQLVAQPLGQPRPHPGDARVPDRAGRRAVHPTTWPSSTASSARSRGCTSPGAGCAWAASTTSPRVARLVARRGETYVWVDPAVGDYADFSLLILNIATPRPIAPASGGTNKISLSIDNLPPIQIRRKLGLRPLGPLPPALPRRHPAPALPHGRPRRPPCRESAPAYLRTRPRSTGACSSCPGDPPPDRSRHRPDHCQRPAGLLKRLLNTRPAKILRPYDARTFGRTTCPSASARRRFSVGPWPSRRSLPPPTPATAQEGQDVRAAARARPLQDPGGGGRGQPGGAWPGRALGARAGPDLDLGPRTTPLLSSRRSSPAGRGPRRSRPPADNGMTIYVNGRMVASSDAWAEPIEVHVR